MFSRLCDQADPTSNVIKWDGINFTRLLDKVVYVKDNFYYENQWVSEIFKNDLDGQYGASILRFFGEEKSSIKKLKLINSIIKDGIIDYKAAIKINLLPIIMKRQTNDIKRGLLIDLFFILLDHNKIFEDYYGNTTISELINFMESDQQMKLVNHPNLTEILSPLEVDELRRSLL